jgi:superfamily II DNA helicase RecQ
MDVQIKTFRISQESDEKALNDFLHNKVIRHWSTTFVPGTSGMVGALTSAITGNESGAVSDAGTWNVFVAFEERMSDGHTNQRSMGNNRKQSMTNADDRSGKRNSQQREPQPKKEKAPSPDYVPNVAEADMPLFEAVRKWRNARAREENIKPFTLFNNKQLEELLQAKATTADALRPLVPDMSQELFDKYSNELLGFLSAAASVGSTAAASA